MYIYVCVFLHSAVVKGFKVQQIPAVTCLVTVGVVRHSTNLCGIWLYLTGVVVEINRRVFLSKGLSRLVGLRRHPTSRTRYAYIRLQYHQYPLAYSTDFGSNILGLSAMEPLG